MMTDRNPEGRDTGEGFEAAVLDKSVQDLLTELVEEIRKLRLALTLAGVCADLNDLN